MNVFMLLKEKETPFCAKFFAVLTIAYALSPIDLIWVIVLLFVIKAIVTKVSGSQ